MFLSVEGTCRPTFMGVPPDDLLSMPRPLCAHAGIHSAGGLTANNTGQHKTVGDSDEALAASLAGSLHLVPPGNPFAEPPEGQVSPPVDRGNLGPAVGGQWGAAVLADVPAEVLALLRYLRPRLQQPGT